MELILVRAISWFSDILITLLCIQAIMSWFVTANRNLMGAYQKIQFLTEPFVAPCRKILQNFNTGMIDFSLILAFFLIRIVARVLIAIVTIIF